MVTWVFKVKQFYVEVRGDLWGHSEAVMTEEAIKMAVGGNMHMDIRVINVTDDKNLNLNLSKPLWTEVCRAIALLFIYGSFLRIRRNW